MMQTAGLRWSDLTQSERTLLARRLEGLFGHPRDAAAFDLLAFDKQQALLIFARRFEALGLWHHVRRIENVYGLGGVGINFAAWPGLLAALRASPRFSSRFASHRDTTGGFLERGRRAASLHFLYVEKSGRRLTWAAHFDLFYPFASPQNALRHLLDEKLRGRRPDWRAIDKALRER